MDMSLWTRNAFVTGAVFHLLYLIDGGRGHTNLVAAFLLLLSLVLSSLDFAWRKTDSIQWYLPLLNTKVVKKVRYV